MKKFITRKGLSLLLAGVGLALIGADLLITRDFFTHIGELMVASLLCFAAAIYLDRTPQRRDNVDKKDTCCDPKSRD